MDTDIKHEKMHWSIMLMMFQFLENIYCNYMGNFKKCIDFWQIYSHNIIFRARDRTFSLATMASRVVHSSFQAQAY